MAPLNLKNKKILITQYSLHILAGSEVTVLELAEFFKTNGANVLVFTWFLDNPMKEEFKKRNIDVTTDENDIRFANIDIAWIHHQVIPIKLLKLLKSKQEKPSIFFYHMSPLDNLSIERPYLGNLESKIADKVFFSSEGTKDSLLQLFPSLKSKAQVIENLLPESFCKANHKATSLKKILIVSNHPPEEIQTATSLLSEQGLTVDYIGQNKKAELITVETLTKYDLVITIGKTVIYCLGSNVPVYVYDHFGGPGFLSETNIEKTRYRTFSGRGFKKKSPEQIIKELQEKYQSAIIFQEKNLNNFRNEFSIQNQLSNALNNFTHNKPSYTISEEEFNTLSAVLSIVYSKIQADNLVYIKNDKIKLLEKELKQLNDEYEKIINSKKYRFLSKLSNIIHFTKIKS